MKPNILLLILFALFFSSCKKSFLEIPSKTTLTTTTFFKTEDDFKKALSGVYEQLRFLYDGLEAMWAVGENHSDNSFYAHNPGHGYGNRNDMNLFTVSAATSVSENLYILNYKIIARANQILSLIDGVAINDDVKKNIKGQALFLRAHCYFNVVQMFGKVPLHLTPVTSFQEAALPLSDADKTYAQIIADATQAATLLPNKATQEAGRVTSGSAKTLLGNVYIVLKKWSEAETVLKEVVSSAQYSLMPDYAAIFNPANKNNSESVFEIQYKNGSEGYSNGNIYWMLPQPISQAKVVALTGASDAQGLAETGYNIPTPDLIAAYAPGDLRKDVTIGTILGDNGITYPFAKKFLHPHAQFKKTNDNWIVYRYTEVLLFLAEALNEQGKTAGALTYLNQVHAHARTGLTPMLSISQNIIFDERRIELALEGKRWFDLVRSGKAIATITAYGAKVKLNPQTYYYPVGYKPPLSAFSKIELLLPLPASEALLSPFF